LRRSSVTPKLPLPRSYLPLPSAGRIASEGRAGRTATDGAGDVEGAPAAYVRGQQLRDRLVLRDRGHHIGGGELAALRTRLDTDAGGRRVVPHLTPRGLDDFVEQVVPLLQERGAFRTEYTGTTLRSHLGLAEPVWKG
jgi:alkanesulfonate monooxygenase SsuD/methylene tetrahydromethanopterin reductase-like flavin-dependent oxidoreductase (luciferase family)